MTTLIVGASGATGRLLVEELLNRGARVKVVVRSRERLPQSVRDHDNLSVVEASISDMSDADMARLVRGCAAVVSCLGHTMSFRGVFGGPRRLVTDATRRLCAAIRENAPAAPVKFVLMNTTGNRNRDLDERISFAQACAIGLLRLVLPPHVDNEQAADFLRKNVGQSDPFIEWAAVRPDTLIDEVAPTAYDVYPSPIRSAIFDAGITSRNNVAHFMAALVSGGSSWEAWKGKMPVIYNAATS